MAGNWWDDDPERYDSEISELERAGIRWERDDDAFAAGRLRLRVFPVVDGEELPLVAVFPDEYPWFKFEVEAPTLALPHHQHAFGKVLCLLPRSTEHWRPGSDRLAHFLVERLPLVIATGASEDAAAAAEIEEHQAEPFSDYYTYERNAIVLVDGHWSLPVEARSGRLVLGLEALPPGVKPNGHLRGAIIEIHDDRGGGPIATAEHAHATRFPYRVEGRWARVESPPASNDPSTVYSLMEAADPQRGRLREVDIQHSQRMWIRAVLFPEEHRWRGDALASSAHG